MIHTAQISKPKDGERILKGEFTYENGKLDFQCHTQNVPFEEVLEAIMALREECNRQINNKEKCPFHKPSFNAGIQYALDTLPAHPHSGIPKIVNHNIKP